MERKERVYISGPISGHDKEERRRAFKEIQLRLEKLGLEVFNPLENGIPAEATTQRHMHRDLATLTREENPDCDEIVRRYQTDKEDIDEYHLVFYPTAVIYNEGLDIHEFTTYYWEHEMFKNATTEAWATIFKRLR